jgi:hypothetical protein
MSMLFILALDLLGIHDANSLVAHLRPRKKQAAFA